MCMLAIQRLRLLENLLAALSGAAVVHGPSAWRRCICAKLYYLNVMSNFLYASTRLLRAFGCKVEGISGVACPTRIATEFKKKKEKKEQTEKKK